MVRTDDDSWDISESVGATAVGVAAMRAAETRRPDALFQDPYAAKLVAAVGAGWERILRGEIGTEADRARVYGSMGAMMTARTLFLDAYFRAAVADGVRQFVILASGLDARAYRLEYLSGTVIFEIDQPKVLEFKNGVLAQDTPAADRRTIAVDLRQDWPAALRDNGFDPAAPTAWLAEGLLRYLPADAQDRLLENVVELSAPASRIGLNMGQGDRQADPRRQAERAKVMEQAGIRIDIDNLWYSTENRSDPREWFAERGWTVSVGEVVDVLAAHDREVPEEVAADLSRLILMTAIRPREEDSR